MKQLRISFSGPSSSGKSEMIQRTKEWFESLGLSVGVRASESRKTFTETTTLEERGSASTQLKLLEDACAAEKELLASANDILLLDRTILDGYVYFKQYQTGTEQQYAEYYNRVVEMLAVYDMSFLFNAVVFKEDGIRKSFDRQFANTFVEQYTTLWPSTANKLISIRPIDGLDETFLEVKNSILTSLEHKNFKHIQAQNSVRGMR